MKSHQNGKLEVFHHDCFLPRGLQNGAGGLQKGRSISCEIKEVTRIMLLAMWESVVMSGLIHVSYIVWFYDGTKIIGES